MAKGHTIHKCRGDKTILDVYSNTQDEARKLLVLRKTGDLENRFGDTKVCKITCSVCGETYLERVAFSEPIEDLKND